MNTFCKHHSACCLIAVKLKKPIKIFATLQLYSYRLSLKSLFVFVDFDLSFIRILYSCMIEIRILKYSFRNPVSTPSHNEYKNNDGFEDRTRLGEFNSRLVTVFLFWYSIIGLSRNRNSVPSFKIKDFTWKLFLIPFFGI